MLFDTRRDLYYSKPALRGWLGLLWFEASLVVGTLLLTHAHGGRQITAVAVSTATVAGLFGTSAVYHRGNWGPLASRWLQRLDHVMIFLLIAGTRNVAFLLTAANPYDALRLPRGVPRLCLCGGAMPIHRHSRSTHTPVDLYGRSSAGRLWAGG